MEKVYLYLQLHSGRLNLHRRGNMFLQEEVERRQQEASYSLAGELAGAGTKPESVAPTGEDGAGEGDGKQQPGEGASSGSSS